MELTEVLSTNIRAIGYEEESNTLAVKFAYGDSIYHYFQVPSEVYKLLMASPSVGSFFEANIKHKYKFQKQ